jgi:arsenate reductase
MKARIYHNPRCSKSRATLALLEARGIDVDVVEYLREPPTFAELRELLGKLGLPAREILRAGEAEFKTSGLALDAGDEALLELIAAQPKLLQRPIVVVGDSARIGRPPENVLALLR